MSSGMDVSSSSIGSSMSQESSKEGNGEVDLENLPSDPGLRPSIMSYPPNILEQVRRAYLLQGPCQPYAHDFPHRMVGNRKRKFVSTWFDEFKDWLEYSIEKDAVFCMYCYLFPRLNGKGHDAFVSGGFSSWNKKERLRDHVGDHNSGHNRCRLACQELMNQAQSIGGSLEKASEQSKPNQRCILNTTISWLHLVIKQGLAFQVRDYEFSSHDNTLVLKNPPDFVKVASLETQIDIIRAAAFETIKAIVLDIGNGCFSIFVDVCRDVTSKEQMGVVVRYVNKDGCVIERFIGLVDFGDMTALSLKEGLDSLFSTYGLSMSRLRGLGYDGASYMKDEFSGLQSLILERNPSAYNVHSFAHQLQHTIVAVAKHHISVGLFFLHMTRLCNVMGGSCRGKDMVLESQRMKITECFANDGMKPERGLNKEFEMERPEDTHQSSHHGTLVLMDLFSSILDVLEYAVENSYDDSLRGQAYGLLDPTFQFEFVFVLHLMKQILDITHELSQALLRKDEDIVSAMNLVKVAKMRLQVMRDDGWESLVSEVSKFCSLNEIDVLDMEDEYVPRGGRRRREEIGKMTNLHFYRVELFYFVIDLLALELNQCFDEVKTELLLCLACFDPRDSFSAFDTEKLLRLAKYYPSDFSDVDLYRLES